MFIKEMQSGQFQAQPYFRLFCFAVFMIDLFSGLLLVSDLSGSLLLEIYKTRPNALHATGQGILCNKGDASEMPRLYSLKN